MYSLNIYETVVFTCCILIANHNAQSLHFKMDPIMSSSSVRTPVEGETGGNHSFNGTNMTAVRKPCIDCLVFAPVYLVILVLTLAILSLVVAAKALPRVIRFVLANILIANFTAGLGILVIVLARVIVTRTRRLSLTDTPCRFLIAFISVGGTSRPLIMAVFAVVVCIVIMKSISTVKFKFLTLGMLTMWLACVAFSSTLLFPNVMKVYTLQDTGCVPRRGDYLHVYTIPFFLCFVLIPFTLNVVLLITAFWYARANTVSENAASLRPMLKFSTFLFLGNLLSVMGQAIPVIVAYVETDSPRPEVILAINRSNGIIVFLSIIPTPILVLVYFKPVRALMNQCLLRIFSKMCKKSLGMFEQGHLADRMLVSPNVYD